MRIEAAALIALLLVSVPAAAQKPQAQRPGAVHVVVHDATGLPLHGANVTLTAPDGSAVKVPTNDRGEATFDGIPPSAYSGLVESAGFNSLVIETFSIRAGERARREVTLQLAGFVEQLEVTPNGDDRELMDAFARQLTADQLAALPEDPEELAFVLRQLAGGDADIRVDGFRGGRLPRGSEIQDVRIRYDVGAASTGGGSRIEIRTRVGGDRWRNDASLSVRDEALSARNAFRAWAPGRSDAIVLLELERAACPAPNGSVHQHRWRQIDGEPDDSCGVPWGRYLLQRARTAFEPLGIWTRRAAHCQSRADHSPGLPPRHKRRAEPGNRRIGFARARIQQQTVPSGELRAEHHTTLRQGLVNDVRFSLEWDSTEVTLSAMRERFACSTPFPVAARSTRRTPIPKFSKPRTSSNSRLRRQHQIQPAVTLLGSDYRGDEHGNAGGTYTFTTLASFEAGQPTDLHATASATQPIGTRCTTYGWHIQDDYRLRRNLMVNLGLRHDVQTHVDDWANFSPRSGSAGGRLQRRGRLSVRAWAFSLAARMRNVWADPARQRSPATRPGDLQPRLSGPILGRSDAGEPAPSIIRARADLQIPVSRRYSLGVDQPVGKFVRFRGTFSRELGTTLSEAATQCTLWRASARIRPFEISPSWSRPRGPERVASNRAVGQLSPPAALRQCQLRLRQGDERNRCGILAATRQLRFDGEWGPARGDVRQRVNAV